MINLFNLHFTNNTCSYFLRSFTSQFVTLVTYVKYLNFWLSIQYLTKKKRQRKKKKFKLNGFWKQISRGLDWMEILKADIWCFVTSSGLLLDIWRLLFRLDFQKFLICLLIKRFGRPLVSKHATDPLKRSADILKHSIELLKHSVKLLRV